MAIWTILKRLDAKAEKYRSTKDCVYEDDEKEEGTLYETLRDAAMWINNMSISLSVERGSNEELQAALRDCVVRGDIPQAVLDRHEKTILRALDAHDEMGESAMPMSKENKKRLPSCSKARATMNLEIRLFRQALKCLRLTPGITARSSGSYRQFPAG